MSEYIDREELVKFLDNLQQPKFPITKNGFKFISIIDAIKVVSERPIADVVEKEKINKAIDEMGKLASQPISLDQKDAINMCIKILKRNIER